MYEVSYNSGPLEMKNLIYRGLDNSFSFKLPEGDHNKDHKGTEMSHDVISNNVAFWQV